MKTASMETLLNWWVTHSLQAGILVVLVVCVQWLFRRQLSARWRFALWWVVLARLVLPFNPESALSLFNFFKPTVQVEKLQPMAPVPVRVHENSKIEPVPLNRTVGVSQNSLDSLPAVASEPATSPASAQKERVVAPLPAVTPQIAKPAWNARAMLVPGLMAAWLSGVVMLTALVLVQVVQFHRRLGRTAQPVASELQRTLNDCLNECGVTKPVTVVETEAVQSPALFGLFHLRLLLPRQMANQFTQRELRCIFLHELAHVKRRDLWLNWLVTSLQILHWFNPFLWLGFARLRADRELACDEFALVHMEDAAGAAYGETVIKLLENLNQPGAIPGMVGILEDKQQMRRRIAMIAAFRKARRWPVLAALLLTAMAVTALTDAQSNKSPDGALSIKSVVVDELGRPVAGATIDCYNYQIPPVMMSRMFRQPELTKQTVTDAKGAFTVPVSPDTTFVLARKAGLAPAWKTWSRRNADTPEPLVLTAPTTLSGVVVDEQNQPVPGAAVWVSAATVGDEDGHWSSQVNDVFGPLARECFSARTTTDGHFQINNLPANAHVALMVEKPGMSQRATAGHFLGSQDFRSGDENIKLQLAPAGVIEGKAVVRETGQPVAGVEVWLLPSDGNSTEHGPAKSGSDGTFRLADLQPAKYNLWAVLPDWMARTSAIVENYDMATVTAGETNRDVVVRTTAGVSVEISVVSTNDLKPLANVAVTCGRLTAYTDKNGKAVLRTIPGKSWFSVSKSDWSPVQTTAEIVSGQTNRVLILMVPPPHISGIMRDPAGVPVSGALVSFHPGRYPAAPFYGETETDENGHYDLLIRQDSRGFTGWFGMSNPTNFVLVQDFSRNLSAIQEFGTSERNFEGLGVIPTNLDLTLQSGITISGSVKDGAGLPITNVAVNLTILSGNSFANVENKPAKVDEHGMFSFPALPQGREYEIFNLTAKGYGSAFGFVKPEQTRTNRFEFPDFVLKKADKILAGQVIGANGKPVADVPVRFYGKGQKQNFVDTLKSDRQGRFIFQNVCAGPVTVAADFEHTSANVSAQGGDTNVVLRLGITLVQDRPFLTPPIKTAGIVRNAQGKPVAGVKVSMFSYQGGFVDSQTDTNGRYDFTWQKRLNNEPVEWLTARDFNNNSAAINEIDETITNLDLVLEDGLTISTRVSDTDGRLLTNATAMVTRWLENRGHWVSSQPANADDRGNLRILSLPQAQKYSIKIEAPGHTSATIQLNAEKTKIAMLELPPVVLTPMDGEVSGRVLEADGTPASGVEVQVFATGTTAARTTADASGHFEYHNVSRGALSFMAGLPIPMSSALNNSGRALGKSGDTNIVIHLGSDSLHRH